LETDNFIQTQLRDTFRDCTVLVIAHRLATVIDSDRILVMSEGRAEEFDHPFKLLVKSIEDTEITMTDGYFAKMVLATGADNAKQLFEIAKSQYEKNNKYA
jgi:ABC-type transport system involved in cytochrome bd biosynthesis fused ATPase/permease subunit